MKESNELLEHIYKDASMGSYTMEHLLEDLKRIPDRSYDHTQPESVALHRYCIGACTHCI